MMKPVKNWNTRSDRQWYLRKPSDFDGGVEMIAKFCLHIDAVLFAMATLEYIDNANLIKFTVESARDHWAYLTSKGFVVTDQTIPDKCRIMEENK
jgi:hypothetical protein